MMAMSRVPFPYTLVDKRHKPFVEGKRNVLLTPFHYIISVRFLVALCITGVGLAFLWQGGSGLAHDFSVRNDWVTTEASIVAVVPIQSGDRFNWHYFYTFQTEDGQQGSGKIVEGNKTAFREGQQVIVRYLRTDPAENVYAHEKMPKSVLYWVLVGIGSLWVYVTAKPIYRHFLAYWRLRAISHRGRPLPGEILAVHYPPPDSSDASVEIEYKLTSPPGSIWKGRDTIPLMALAGNPEPGTAVAVWWAGDGVMVLL
jgi:hypothetical protein